MTTGDQATTWLRHARRGLTWTSFEWWYPIALFLAVRSINAIWIATASHDQLAVTRATTEGMYIHTEKPADPGYWSVITNWDGQWYEAIASNGYQVPTVTGTDSAETLWAWAFPPLFPMLARGLMLLTGQPFAVASTILNLLAGAAGMVLLFRILDRAGGRFLAVAGVALANCFVSAPLFQAAYSESLAFLLLMATFLTVQSRRYWLSTAFITLLGFTRLITAPLALVGLVLLVARWRRRRTDPLTPRESAGLAAVVVVSVISTVAWSSLTRVVTPISTGASARLNAQTSIHLGWFSDTYQEFGLVGPVVVCLFLLVLLARAVGSRSRHWGLELRTWLIAYPSFLMLVTGLSGGILRYLLLCPPLALVMAGDVHEARRSRIVGVVSACVVGLILQYYWIQSFLALPAKHFMP